MPTGGLQKKSLIHGISAALVLWLAIVAYALFSRTPDPIFVNIVRIFPFVTFAMYFVSERARQALLLRTLFWISVVVWLTASWPFKTGLDFRLFLMCILTVPVVGGLLPVFEEVTRRWQAISSPVIRVAIGACVTAAAVFTALFAFEHFSGPIDWHSIFVENWDLTLVLIYLPAMALIAFGFYRHRMRKKNGK